MNLPSVRSTVFYSTTILALHTAGSVQAAVIADFAADFSSSSNPTGLWTYGSVTTLGSAPTVATLVTNYGPGSEVNAWSPFSTSWPTIGLNTSVSPVSFGAGNSITLASGQGILHPGPTGAFANVRYTASATFTGMLDVAFSGVSSAGTTTDAHILLNGVSLLSGNVNGFGATQAYHATVSLAPGDVLDFAVGWGTNLDFNDDSTGFVATISTVPEPGATCLVALGLAGFAATRRRNRE